jgi:hypothetical protein
MKIWGCGQPADRYDSIINPLAKGFNDSLTGVQTLIDDADQNRLVERHVTKHSNGAGDVKVATAVIERRVV